MPGGKEALREEIAGLAREVRDLRGDLAAQRAAHHCGGCHCAAPAPSGWWHCAGCGQLACGVHVCAQPVSVAAMPYISSVGESPFITVT